jgi:hypothetical protein
MPVAGLSFFRFWRKMAPAPFGTFAIAVTWRATGLPWYSVTSPHGCSRMAGPKVPVAIEMSLSFDRAPSRSTPTTRLHKSNPKGGRLRQTYSSGVLLVLGARTHKPSLIDIRYAPIAIKFCMAPKRDVSGADIRSPIRSTRRRPGTILMSVRNTPRPLNYVLKSPTLNLRVVPSVREPWWLPGS